MSCANNCTRDCDCAESDNPAWFKVVAITVFVGFALLIAAGALDANDEQVIRNGVSSLKLLGIAIGITVFLAVLAASTWAARKIDNELGGFEE